jgi:putative serine protease PepD
VVRRPKPLVVAAVVATAVALVLLGVIAWSVSRPGPAVSCDAGRVAASTMPSVVTIYVSNAAGPAGSGSGEFLDPAGHILTNNHVISAAAGGGTITVLRPNGAQLPATLVGRDPVTDLAVLKVEPESPAVPVTFAEAVPAIGTPVFAVGAPLGLSDTFTAGIISGLGRSVRVPSDNNTTALLVSALQTDASINPGNSGGLLADCSGSLVGVPTAGATASDSLGHPVAGNIGLGFAIPAATARRVSDRLISDGRFDHGDFGLAVIPISADGSAVEPDGLYLSSVTARGPGAQAGLRQSDIITALDGDRIRSADQLQEVALTRDPGATVLVDYRRAGVAAKATVTLGGPPT